MTNVPLPLGPGRTIRQDRSRKSYEAFVATGFKLLENHEFDAITIAELAQRAGYSVGAFYARFQSKDQFFEAMVAHHIQERSRARQRILANAPRDTLIGALIKDLIDWYWRRRRFWRAALLRSVRDPDFWEPINRSAQEFVVAVTTRIQLDVGRQLTQSESANVVFAIHMVLGMVNNRIVNRPRPSWIGNETFAEDLTRAFLLVSEYESLNAGDSAAQRRRRRRR
jgi:AcrR family transcriptional regulator